MDSKTLARFESKYVVDPSTECWLWTACCFPSGYAQLRLAGKTRLAHVLSYEHFVGPVPEDRELDHTCRARNCVFYRHLEPVTHKENVLRGMMPMRHRMATHCPQGHAYDETNTIIKSNGSRGCKACAVARATKHRRAAGSKPKRVAQPGLCVNGHKRNDPNRPCNGCLRDATRRYRAKLLLKEQARSVLLNNDNLEAFPAK
jgi:hypothetical protein